MKNDIEYFDSLDEFGNKIGKIGTKEQIINEGNFYRIVNLYIINPKTKQILIQKRSKTKKVNSNKWDITTGGHIKAGESSMDAIIRETKEEIGIDISKDNVIKVLEFNNKKNVIVDIYFLEKEIDIKSISLQKSEVEDIKYFLLEELIKAYNENNSNFVNHNFFPLLIKSFENYIK